MQRLTTSALTALLFASLLASCTAATTLNSTAYCEDNGLTPELTEGPYYLDEEIFRNNLTESQNGVPLILMITVVDENTCEPVPEVLVDIWHCNATGFYSGFTGTGAGSSNSSSTSSPSTPPTAQAGRRLLAHNTWAMGRRLLQQQATQTDNLTFLRGVAQADEQGFVEFTTVFPGFYSGRTNHVHVKVHVPENATVFTDEEEEYADSHVSHTGQFFFDDNITDTLIATVYPYTINPTVQKTTRMQNDEDGIYSSGGSSQVLALEPIVPGDYSQGFYGPITITIDASATAASVSAGGMSGNSTGSGQTSARGPSGSLAMGPMPLGGMPSGSRPGGK